MRLIEAEWDHSTSETWKGVSKDFRAALDFLLQRFGDPACRLADIQGLQHDVQKLFLIDGLNETPGSVPDEPFRSVTRPLP